MVQQNVTTLALIIADVLNPFFPEVTAGVLDAADERGWPVVPLSASVGERSSWLDESDGHQSTSHSPAGPSTSCSTAWTASPERIFAFGKFGPLGIRATVGTRGVDPLATIRAVTA
ncbi:hypothetical protein [Nonomuraea roseoviolacea]|uniref:Uncharacterized protein n=1 Tax=Nonomuraea roseoviolacea subsp. carminata TaxID=160689 RepID=A0ABT1KCD4_9ACTN|nr:hypothetical protein [Nonomuraea roseoviolacea]MCP2351676.1 hypothetical protein [Nonomuraea roseoviolacea subsp. carminata]